MTDIPIPIFHAGLSEEEKYLFDTLGFIVIKGVLSAHEVLKINEAIDRRPEDFYSRDGALRNSKNGLEGRLDCGNFMTWPNSDAGDLLRGLLCHPRLFPILNSVCGNGHRLDHTPLLFKQPPGVEGFDLHGGAISPDGKYSFPISYHCHAGQIMCNLVNMAVQLSPSPPGSGGFVIIPGSHKSNFASPPQADRRHLLADTYGIHPVCDIGDVVLFAEAALHGATVRNTNVERRVALLRFAPATCAFGRGYHNFKFIDYLTPSQRAVVEVPYNAELDRVVPVLPAMLSPGTEGTILTTIDVCVPNPRREDKKNFDQVVFQNDYY